MTTKHLSFDEYAFLLSKQVSKRNIRKVYYGSTTDGQHKMVDESKQSLKPVEKVSDSRDSFEINDDESDETDQPHQMVQETTQEGTPRYPRRARKSLQLFKINALRRSCTLEEPSLTEVLTGEEKDIWRDAKRSDVRALDQIDCWDILKCQSDEQVLHTMFFEKKRDEKGVVRSYKACPAICENEEVDFQEETLSPVMHHFIKNLMLCLSIKKGLVSKHLHFENAFPNMHPKSPVYDEMRVRIFPDS